MVLEYVIPVFASEESRDAYPAYQTALADAFEANGPTSARTSGS